MDEFAIRYEFMVNFIHGEFMVKFTRFTDCEFILRCEAHLKLYIPFPDPGNRPYGRKWKIAPVCPGSLPLTIPVFLPVEGVTGRV